VDKLIHDINNQKVVLGLREVTRYICSSNIRCVVIAGNAENFIIDKVTNLCKVHNVSYRFTPSKEEIGRAAGLDVPCAVVGFIKEQAKTH